MAVGQLGLLRSRTPIETILANPETPDDTRAGLELVLDARRFAASLGLEVDGQYTHYTEWPGDHLVTTVVATRQGELNPVGFWFPIVGNVPYKGFFESDKAEAEATRLRDEGYDVCVSPVRAYSTLGWFADPITGPMLRQGPERLVETVIHELVHATVFAKSQADFNESIATFIGEEGRVAFFAETEGPDAGARERARVIAARAYRGVLEDTRQRLASLYSGREPRTARLDRKKTIHEDARRQIALLDGVANRSGASRGARLNDACLALAGTYGAHIERYAAWVAEQQLELPELILRAQEAAKSDAPLESLGISP